MSENNLKAAALIDEPVYQERVRSEIEHYSQEYQKEESRRTLTEEVPSSYSYIEDKAHELIRLKNEGRGMLDQVIHHMRAHADGRMVSIGSGPGGIELEIARQLRPLSIRIVCLDINPKLTELGSARARSEDLSIEFVVQDINDLVLEPESCDLIFCHASLHHLISLEHIFYEMNRALKTDGQVVIVDVVTRNGYRMWEETHAVVKALWKLLPDRFKFNHTAYATVVFDEDYPNRDYGSGSMECARSQDILPLLNEYFQCQVYVPYMCISRRFFDTMYGPNYDLSQSLDRSIVEFIWNLDVDYISRGLLRPETFFGIYAKGPDRPRPNKIISLSMIPAGQTATASVTSDSIAATPLAQLPLTQSDWDEFGRLLAAYRGLRHTRLFGWIRSFVRWLK